MRMLQHEKPIWNGSLFLRTLHIKTVGSGVCGAPDLELCFPRNATVRPQGFGLQYGIIVGSLRINPMASRTRCDLGCQQVQSAFSVKWEFSTHLICCIFFFFFFWLLPTIFSPSGRKGLLTFRWFGALASIHYPAHVAHYHSSLCAKKFVNPNLPYGIESTTSGSSGCDPYGCTSPIGRRPVHLHRQSTVILQQPVPMVQRGMHDWLLVPVHERDLLRPGPLHMALSRLHLQVLSESLPGFLRNDNWVQVVQRCMHHYLRVPEYERDLLRLHSLHMAQSWLLLSLLFESLPGFLRNDNWVQVLQRCMRD
jgi:hypothetical protein